MKPFVVVGAVAAGMSAASQLKRDFPHHEVIVFGKEPYISYGACGMPFVVSGEIPSYQKLMVLKPEKAIEERKINLKIKHEVIAVLPNEKKVQVKNLETQETFFQEYEKLILATGASAINPPFKGRDLEGIFLLKELQDCIVLTEYIKTHQPKKAVVVGGGFIGIETAIAFQMLGIDVTVVEAAPRVVNILDTEMGQRVEEELIRNKITLLTSEKVAGFEGNQKIEKVLLESGKTLEADLVLLSIGVAPNNLLAKEAGIQLGARGAILTNLYQQTSDPNIYAAGDCSTVYHKILDKFVFIPLALGANRQGRMCAENIHAEINKKPLTPFPGILGTSMLKVFDYEIGKTGIGEAEINAYNLTGIKSAEVKYFAKAGYYEKSRIWVKLYFYEDSQIIVGGQIVGQNGSVLRLDTLVAVISAKMTLKDLYELDLGYTPPFSPVWDPLLVAARASMKE